MARRPRPRGSSAGGAQVGRLRHLLYPRLRPAGFGSCDGGGVRRGGPVTRSDPSRRAAVAFVRNQACRCEASCEAAAVLPL